MTNESDLAPENAVPLDPIEPTAITPNLAAIPLTPTPWDDLPDGQHAVTPDGTVWLRRGGLWHRDPWYQGENAEQIIAVCESPDDWAYETSKWPACSTYPALGCVCRGGLAPSKSTCTRKRTGDLQPVARMSQPRAKGGNHLDTRDARQWPWPMFVTAETVQHAPRGALHEWGIDCDTSGVCVPVIMRDVERPRLTDPQVDGYIDESLRRVPGRRP